MTGKSKHILFLYETLEELINKSGYKPPFAITPFCSPQMSIDELLNILLKKEKYQDACELMAFSMRRRANIWWGISLLRALYKEKEEKAQKKSDNADLEKEKKNEKNLAIKQEKLDGKAAETKDSSVSEKMSAEKAEEIENAINEVVENRKSEYDSSSKEFEEIIKEQDSKNRKLMDEAIQSLSPEEKGMFQERVNAVNDFLKQYFGMDQNQIVEFAKKTIDKITEAEESNDPAKMEAVTSEFAAFAAGGKHMNDDCEKKLNDIFGDIQSEQSDKKETIIEEKDSKVPSTEQKSEAELEVEAKAKAEAEAAAEEEKLVKNITDNLRAQAFESVLAWLKDPTDKNSIAAEKAGNKVSSYSEGKLALAAYWSYGDLNLSANMNQADDSKKMIIHVDPSMPPKAVNSCIILAASDDGGYRSPAERYKVFFEIGDKIATGEDDMVSALIKQKMAADLQTQAEQELAALRAKKGTYGELPIASMTKENSKKINEDSTVPTYKKWKLD